MKKLIKLSTLFIALLITSTVFAQIPNMSKNQDGRQGPPPIPNVEQIEQMVTELAVELSLSEEQQAGILNMYIAHFAEVEETMSAEPKPPREEMESKRTEFDNQVKSLLTDEQRVKFDEFNKKRHQHNGQKKGKGKKHKSKNPR